MEKCPILGENYRVTMWNLVRRYPVVATTLAIGVTGLVLLWAGQSVVSGWLVGGYALAIAAWQAWSMIRDLLRGNFGLDVLAVTAITATVLVGDHWAALIVVLMLTGGEALEDYANARAHREVSALLKRAPRFAHRATPGGTFVEVPISEVVAGDLIMVRPGEVVPVDGVLEGEAASFDESSITGEPLPVEHAHGDQVLSGTVSQQKVALVRATLSAKDSQYQQIIDLVQAAAESKSPIVRLADRYAVPFTAVSLVIAGVAWWLSGDPGAFRRGPGRSHALPAADRRAGGVPGRDEPGREQRRDRQVRRGDGDPVPRPNRRAGQDRHHHPRPARRRPCRTGPGRERRRAARHRCRGRDLLRARAGEDDRERGPPPPPPHPAGNRRRRDHSRGHDRDDPRPAHRGRQRQTRRPRHRAHPARGRPSRRDTSPSTSAAPRATSDASCSPTRCATTRPRPCTPLHHLGVRSVAMLTGDAVVTARHIAALIGIDDVRAGLLPADKVAQVASLPGRPVAMVGGRGQRRPRPRRRGRRHRHGRQGRHCGASESADVVIMLDDLSRVATSIAIARRTVRIALQAIWLGIAISIGLMLVAVWGILPAIAGAALQELVDLAAILTALRAVRPGPTERELARKLRAAVEPAEPSNTGPLEPAR